MLATHFWCVRNQAQGFEHVSNALFLPLSFWGFSCFEAVSQSPDQLLNLQVAKDSLELLLLPTTVPECWDYRHARPHLAGDPFSKGQLRPRKTQFLAHGSTRTGECLLLLLLWSWYFTVLPRVASRCGHGELNTRLVPSAFHQGATAKF